MAAQTEMFQCKACAKRYMQAGDAAYCVLRHTTGIYQWSLDAIRTAEELARRGEKWMSKQILESVAGTLEAYVIP